MNKENLRKMTLGLRPKDSINANVLLNLDNVYIEEVGYEIVLSASNEETEDVVQMNIFTDERVDGFYKVKYSTGSLYDANYPASEKEFSGKLYEIELQA